MFEKVYEITRLIPSGKVATYSLIARLVGTKDSRRIDGICGTTCSVDGALITTDELKTEFRNRDFVKSAGTDVTKQIRVGKAIGSSASIYACYVPQSKSIRTKGCADNQVYILNGSTRTQQTCTAADVANPGWSAANPWSVCVP